MQRRQIGLGIVGSGRIGGLRARIASGHPAVRFIAVSDRYGPAAKSLAKTVGAQFSSTDNAEVIHHPEVDAVVVSTPEDSHMEPVRQALARGIPVLCEKPIALDVKEADRMLAQVRKYKGDLRIGYSRRFKTRYLRAREQVIQGRLGTIVGACARLYNSRAQALAMLSRNAHATPVVDALTYYVDLMAWLIGDNPVVEVTAQGHGTVIRAAGYDADDVTWALLRLADGAVVNLGVCYALPSRYPAVGHAARVELLGTKGVLLIDDDHTDQVMHTEVGFPHVYVPEHAVETVFLGSSTPGDWALGEFWGPIANETRSWLDYLATGKPCALARPDDARATLAVTLAIEQSARTGRTVRLRRRTSAASR